MRTKMIWTLPLSAALLMTAAISHGAEIYVKKDTWQATMLADAGPVSGVARGRAGQGRPVVGHRPLESQRIQRCAVSRAGRRSGRQGRQRAADLAAACGVGGWCRARIVHAGVLVHVSVPHPHREDRRDDHRRLRQRRRHRSVVERQEDPLEQRRPRRLARPGPGRVGARRLARTGCWSRSSTTAEAADSISVSESGRRRISGPSWKRTSRCRPRG